MTLEEILSLDADDIILRMEYLMSGYGFTHYLVLAVDREKLTITLQEPTGAIWSTAFYRMAGANWSKLSR